MDVPFTIYNFLLLLIHDGNNFSFSSTSVRLGALTTDGETLLVS